VVSAVLLVIGGVEQNPGAVAEGDMAVQAGHTGCGRNLKSGIQCELCGRCGNVRAPVPEREVELCRTERTRVLQEELQNALRQIDELKARNRELEEKLQLAGAGKWDTVAKHTGATCLVMGDSMVSNVGTENADRMVVCFRK
jgi:hypothetical protein